MKIHLLSDNHTEHIQKHMKDTIQMSMVAGGTCVLAGDIGSATRAKHYREYLTKIKDQFDHVILVLGNHEFYEMDYFKTLEIEYFSIKTFEFIK